MYEVFFTKCCAVSTKYIKIMKKPLELFATMKKLSTAILQQHCDTFFNVIQTYENALRI